MIKVMTQEKLMLLLKTQRKWKLLQTIKLNATLFNSMIMFVFLIKKGCCLNCFPLWLRQLRYSLITIQFPKYIITTIKPVNVYINARTMFSYVFICLLWNHLKPISSSWNNESGNVNWVTDTLQNFLNHRRK